jgi:hypothetical protein
MTVASVSCYATSNPKFAVLAARVNPTDKELVALCMTTGEEKAAENDQIECANCTQNIVFRY